MNINFHILGTIVAVISITLIYFIFSAFFLIETNTYYAAGFSAFLIMEVSHLFRSWGSKGDHKQVLKSVSYGLGSKVLILVVAFLIINYLTEINIRSFLIILVAIYFLLFIFEVLYMLRIETGKLKKD